MACVAIGKAGAKNAGYLAAQIMASDDEALLEKLKTDREMNAEAVRQKNNGLIS